MSKIDKIKANNSIDTLVKASSKYDVNNEKVSFSFEVFKGESIKIDRIVYNSFYLNVESSRNAVSDFFSVAKEMCRYKVGELLSRFDLKEAYHLNLIDREEHIERIKKVLKEYGFPDKKIQEFDDEYYEYQISDGKRIIWHKIDNNIYPLFVDCNHMICIDSSRDYKAKMSYSVPSSFTHLSENDLSIEDKTIKEFIQQIVDENENNSDLDLEDVIELLKELI